MPQLLEEFVLRAHGVEVEWIARREDDDLLGEVAVIGVVQAVFESISIVLHHRQDSQPSIKSRNNILTLRGLSLLLRSMSAVTIGYLSNSSVLSCGNAFFLGVHLLSRFVSPSPNRVALPRLWWCGTRAPASAGRAPRARHCDARCENSWRKSCVASGESIGARDNCHECVATAVVAVVFRANARGELCGQPRQDGDTTSSDRVNSANCTPQLPNF